MTIQVDTREKPQAIGKILKQFDELGIKHFSSKLYVGDYVSLENPMLVIDRKADLQEICGNVCQQHARFVGELDRAIEVGIHLIILCTHSPQIRCIDDVAGWVNPRLKTSPKALTGEKLAKMLKSIERRHGCEFRFCSRADAGFVIANILSGGEIGADKGR